MQAKVWFHVCEKHKNVTQNLTQFTQQKVKDGPQVHCLMSKQQQVIKLTFILLIYLFIMMKFAWFEICEKA